MNLLDAIILAIVEGLTEYLPVSSTGHMIIFSALLGINEQDFTKIFNVNIQFGAILAVIALYWKRFFKSLEFYYKLFVAFIPAAFFGYFLDSYIDEMLEEVVVVAISLVLGGIILVFIDKLFKENNEPDQITYKRAFIIGLFQCIAMIPGVSRSAATIIGGMTQKLSRKAAAEFSFFLAVPTMFGASVFKLSKNYEQITVDNVWILVIGNIVAFIVAMVAIRSFLAFLTKHGFKVFGYYRIVVGVILLALIYFGYDLKIM